MKIANGEIGKKRTHLKWSEWPRVGYQNCWSDFKRKIKKERGSKNHFHLMFLLNSGGVVWTQFSSEICSSLLLTWREVRAPSWPAQLLCFPEGTEPSFCNPDFEIRRGFRKCVRGILGSSSSRSFSLCSLFLFMQSDGHEHIFYGTFRSLVCELHHFKLISNCNMSLSPLCMGC